MAFFSRSHIWWINQLAECAFYQVNRPISLSLRHHRRRSWKYRCGVHVFFSFSVLVGFGGLGIRKIIFCRWWWISLDYILWWFWWWWWILLIDDYMIDVSEMMIHDPCGASTFLLLMSCLTCFCTWNACTSPLRVKLMQWKPFVLL